VRDHALIDKEDRPGAWDLFIRWKTVRLGNLVLAVVPDQFDGAALLPGGKLESDFGAWRICQAMFLGIIIGHFSLHSGRGIQIKRPKRRVNHMAEPVADCARSKRHPTAPIPMNPE